MAELSELAALGTTPIDGDAAPCGTSARYEPEFEALQDEIGKLEAVEGGEVLWGTAADNAIAVLKTKSKDLLVASYLTMAMYEQHGYAGLAAGLGVCHDLVTTFWDGLFPEAARMRARAAALQWINDRMAIELEKASPPAPSALESIQGCLTALEGIESSVADKFEPGHGPGLRNLKGQLEILRTHAAGGASSGDEAGSSGGESMTSSTGASPAGVAGPIASRDDAMKRLKDIADFLRRTEPHSPIPYLLDRAVNWSRMSLVDVLGELIKHQDAERAVRETLGLTESSE